MNEMQPIELTMQGQNAYAGNMDPRAEAPPQPTQPNNAEQIKAHIRQRMQEQGLPIDRDSEQTINGIATLAQAGLVNIPGLEGPNRPQGERRTGLVDPRGNPLGEQPPVPEAVPTPQRRGRQEAAPLTPEEEEEELRKVTSDRDRERNPELQRKWVQKVITDRSFRTEYFNQIFALVDAQPTVFFDRAFNQLTYGAYYEDFMAVMLQGSVGRILPDQVPDGMNLEEYKQRIKTEVHQDFLMFQRQKNIRQTLHDVSAALYLPSFKAEDLFNYMQNFQSSDGDLAFRLPGVEQMTSIYEQALYESMAENEGYLDPEAVIGKATKTKTEDGSVIQIFSEGEIELRAKKRFKELMDNHMIISRSEDGKEEVIEGMQSWEIDRTFTMARGMMIMTQRLIEIAAESKLPKGGTRYASVFMQDILQSYALNVHMLAKWGITEEALAALLFNSQKKGAFKGWSPKDLYKVYEEYAKDQDKFLETLEDEGGFYLGKRNPNRAGGFFTWNTWRGIENENERSAIQTFLQEGKKRMKGRALAWQAAHSGQELPADYLDEYRKWTGTGFRFEKLRPKIEQALDEESDMKQEERDEVIDKAHALIEKMVEFQGHRFYLTSNHVRDRILAKYGIPEEKNLKEGEKPMILARKQEIMRSNHLEDRVGILGAVEAAFLRDREAFLNSGRTFDSISAADLDQYFAQIVTENLEYKDENGAVVTVPIAQRIAEAKELAWQVRDDFAKNKALYWKEFINKREYNHGFVLWSGDAPVGEYSMAKLGPTGALARRARDNAAQAKAAAAEAGLLDNLKNITHPDQLVSGLFQIWSNIDHYDRAKARQAIAEKAEGYIKFFKEDWKANVPVYGLVRGRGAKASYARMVYGPQAAAWAASDIYYFIKRLEDGKMISKEQAEKLRKSTGSTKKKVLLEGGIAMGQVMAFVFLMLTGESIAKTKWDEM